MLNIEEARQTFVKFQTLMKDWEVRYYKLLREDDGKYRKQALIDLAKIFDEYVYKYDKDEGRMAGPDVGSPPDYDPDTDVIENIESGRSKVTIYVQKTTQFEDRYRHTLAEHNGRWMIEKSEIFWSDKNKWGKNVL